MLYSHVIDKKQKQKVHFNIHVANCQNIIKQSSKSVLFQWPCLLKSKGDIIGETNLTTGIACK